MKVIQCNEGHYYDSERYDYCPICEKIRNAENEKREEEEDLESINEIDFNLLDECKEVTKTKVVQEERKEPHTLQPSDVSELKSKKETMIERPNDDEHTQVSFWGDEIEYNVFEENHSSQDEISNPSDDEKTQVLTNEFTNLRKKQINQNVTYNGPVVGWLVAVNGPHIGQSFELFAKKNFVGRSTDNVVCLSLDKTVSRKHCLVVIFDSHKNQFLAVEGDSDQTIYINDQLLLQPMKLDSYDKIVIGKTTLSFIPFITEENPMSEIYKVGK